MYTMRRITEILHPVHPVYPVSPQMIWQIEHVGEIGSTNDAALARIREGTAASGEVIVARRQSAGRGRQGREWDSQRGGLWMTAVLPALDPLSGSGLAA